MSSLQQLNLTSIPKQSINDPTITRRAKLIVKLEEQKQLLIDPNYLAVDQRWEKSPTGKHLVERKRRVRRWWRQDALGLVYLTIKYGQKQLELEKGKPAILIPNRAGIDDVLNLLIIATRTGELDAALSVVSRGRQIRKK
jgi:hypothetical protein